VELLQVLELQVLPDQLLPLHVDADQVLPDHVLPLQVLAFHDPPDQVEAVASSAAILGASKGIPKMSCSPVSATPSREMWSDPRACSIEPVPVETGQACTEVGRGVLSAAPRSSSPPPIAWALALMS